MSCNNNNSEITILMIIKISDDSSNKSLKNLNIFLCIVY